MLPLDDTSFGPHVHWKSRPWLMCLYPGPASRYLPWQASFPNPIYVFPDKEVRGLSPYFHIHVFVSDLYIPRIGQRIFLPLNRQTDRGKTLPDRGVLTKQLLTAIWRICFSCGHFLPTPLFSLLTQSTLFTERPTSTRSVQEVDRVPCKVVDIFCLLPYFHWYSKVPFLQEAHQYKVCTISG